MDLEDDALSVTSPAPMSSTCNLGGNVTPVVPPSAITPTLPRFAANPSTVAASINDRYRRVSMFGGGPSSSIEADRKVTSSSNAIASHSYNHPIQSKFQFYKIISLYSYSSLGGN